MNSNRFLGVIIAGIILTGLCLGAYGFLTGSLFTQSQQDPWSPRQYVPATGDCFVPPQGDPLYDEHYARNVNVPNCSALVDQADAHYIDATTDQVQFETSRDKFYMGLMGMLFLGIVLFFGWAMLKGGTPV